MKTFRFMLVVFASFALCGCGKQELGSGEYIKYINEESNGLKVSKIIGDIEYTAFFKPVEYIMLNENKGVNDQDKLKDLQYFSLRLSLKEGRGDIVKSDLSAAEEYYERVNYMSYGMQNDLTLVDGTDTLPCRLFNFIRSYGLSPTADFVIAFENRKKISDKILIIDDKVYGGGIVKIKIAKEDIENIPVLR